MQFVYVRLDAGGTPQPRLVEKAREFLAALRPRDVVRATRIMMKAHLKSVHQLLKPAAPSTPSAPATPSTPSARTAPSSTPPRTAARSSKTTT